MSAQLAATLTGGNMSSAENGVRPPLASSLERAVASAQTAEASRGKDVVVLDLRSLTAVCDFFVVVTGASKRQAHAIAEAVDQLLKKDFGDQRLGREGFQDNNWVLLDYGDIVVHVFDGETREYYDLENLWVGSSRIPFEHVSAVAAPTFPVRPVDAGAEVADPAADE